MKRFHVHVSVDDLDANVKFYSTVFGAPPTVVKPDYAKELRVLRARMTAAEVAALDQSDAACCYARSDKYWTTDPQGIPWETFHTLDSIPVYGDTARAELPVCCGSTPPDASQPLKSGACCA